MEEIKNIYNLSSYRTGLLSIFKMAPEVVGIELEISKSKPRKPTRAQKYADQKIQCQYCPRSFSTPRWKTKHCNQVPMS